MMPTGIRCRTMSPALNELAQEMHDVDNPTRDVRSVSRASSTRGSTPGFRGGYLAALGRVSFDKAPMHVANNNAQVRLMMRGKLATGEGIEVHQTTLPPGGAPTATTHHHPHSEMWLIREGTIELTVIDKHYRLEPGSVGFVRSNEEHGIRNVGTAPAMYFVVAVGPGAELQE